MKTSKMSSPESSRNSVFTPQITDAESVKRPEITRYVRMMRAGVTSTLCRRATGLTAERLTNSFQNGKLFPFCERIQCGRSHLRVERVLPRTQGGAGLARTGLRFRGHDGHRRAGRCARDVPLRDELRRPRPHHGRR